VVYSSGDSLFSFAPGDTGPRLLGVHMIDRWTLHSLTWSPDSRWIAYVNGNPMVRENGTVIGWSSIWIVSAEGGEPIPITGQVSAMSPQWLPDSRHILFVSDRDGARAVYVVGVGEDGARGVARPVPGASDPHSISLSADGRRLAYSKFTIAQNIWSIPLSRSRVASIRDAVPVTTGNRFIQGHSLSPDEQWIAFTLTVGGTPTINKVPVTGGVAQRIAARGDGPNWSPDGTEISFNRGLGRQEGMAEIFVMSAEGESQTRLTSFPLGDVQADWSPDGLHLVYQSQGRDGTEPWTLWMLSRDSVGGTWGAPTRVTSSTCHSPAWAPDGASILCALWCRECRPTASVNALIRVTPEGEVLSRLETGDPEWVTRPKYSRDGSVVYFIGSESDGSLGLWSMSIDGAETAKVVAFDDPDLSVVRLAGNSDEVLSVGEEHIYITLAEYESDIWVMDLEWGR
jgi:Tol biopolymer transport system component